MNITGEKVKNTDQNLLASVDGKLLFADGRNVDKRTLDAAGLVVDFVDQVISGNKDFNQGVKIYGEYVSADPCAYVVTSANRRVEPHYTYMGSLMSGKYSRRSDIVDIHMGSVQTITSVGTNTFSNLVNYTGVFDTCGTQMLSTNSFSGCHNMRGVILREGLERIYPAAFAECVNITGDIKIPNSTLQVHDYAFYLAGDSAHSVIIGERDESLMTGIGKYAFNGVCEYGTGYIKIPKSVKKVGDYAFAGMFGISKIFVNCPYSAFSTSVGVFVNTNGTMYLGPNATGYPANPFGLTTGAWTNYPNTP